MDCFLLLGSDFVCAIGRVEDLGKFYTEIDAERGKKNVQNVTMHAKERRAPCGVAVTTGHQTW